MGRYYRLSKKITEETAEEILREIREIEGSGEITFVMDNTCLFVDVDREKYPQIMGRAVNICSRVGKGCELSFAGFGQENK